MMTNLILILAIMIAWGYYLGFVPPVWLNRTWQLAEVHRFLEEVDTYPLDERALMVSHLLRRTTMRVVETADVIVACWADRDELLIIDASPLMLGMARQLDNRAGMIGRVWLEEEAAIINGRGEVAEVEQQLMNELKVKTLMGIPVATAKRVWGLVLVFLVRRPLFETADMSLLTLLAQEMAKILSYTALLAEQHSLINRLNQREIALQQAHKQMQTLAQVAAHLNAQVRSDDSLNAICETVSQLFAVPVVTISLYDEADKVLYLAYDYGLPDFVRQEMRALPRVLHDAYAQLAVPIVVTPDVQSVADLPNRELYMQMGLCTTANVTMWYGDILIGRLNIGTIGAIREFTEQDLTLFKGVADQAAIAIHRASLYQQVQEHAIQLEQHVAERTAELQARNQELDAFAHTVAHDLKSPLALITGFTNLLIDEHEQMDPPEAVKLLHYIEKSSSKMTDIVDALLLLTNTRREDITLEALDMAEIVNNVQQRLTYMVQKYEATIVTPNSWLQAMGYAPWLEEVWANYLSNAIKYGGRPPHVQLGGDAQINGMLRFWVRDNGPGIPLDKQEQLFVPFAQVHDEPVEGSHGLGLSIVARIITRLGGQVGCESEARDGSLFYFTLPCVHEYG
jgi:K+-sensing histidine kinase KdpD